MDCNMKYKLEYSQIVRRKLKALKLYLSEQYGEDLAKTAVKRITDRARELQKNSDLGVDLSAKYESVCSCPEQLPLFFNSLYNPCGVSRN